MSLGNVIQDLVIRIRYTQDTAGLTQVRQAITSLKTSLGSLAFAGLGMSVAHTAVQTAAQLESAQAQFETMLGSKAKSEEMMKKMWEYAAISTFEMSHVTKSMTTLLQHGIQGDDAYAYLKRLGDVAGDSAPKFQRLSLAMSQAISKGRLQGQEVNQFVNAGWNPLNTIARLNFNGNRAAAEKAMTKKKISAGMLVGALEYETSEGGMFYQNQIRQSKTLTGVYTTMIDNLKIGASKAVMALSPLIKDLMRAVGAIDMTPLVKYFTYISKIGVVAKEHWKTLVSYFSSGNGIFQDQLGKLRAKISEILNSREFVTFIRMVTEMVFVAVNVFGALVIVLWNIYRGVLNVMQVIGRAWTFFRERAMFIFDFLTSIPGRIKPVIQALGELWMKLFDSFIGSTLQFKFFHDLLRVIIAGVKFLGELVVTVFERAWPLLKNLAGMAFIEIYKLAENIVMWIAGIFDWVWKKVSPIVEMMKGAVNFIDEKTGVLSVAKNVFNTGKTVLSDAVTDFTTGMDKAGKENITPTMDELIQKVTGSGFDVLKQTVESGRAKVDLKASVDMNVKGDPNTKTGLTAADVALLSERAMRSMFSIQLQEALLGRL